MSELLEFEHEALLNVLNQNSLTISSKGLLNYRLSFNLVRTYCHACHLVFVIGAKLNEEFSIINQIEMYMAQLSEEKLKEFQCPKQIQSEIFSKRIQLYLDGGVFLINSNLLLKDMFKESFPFSSVSGIIVFNAHRILKDKYMPHVLRKFRANNKNGFITALSQNATSFLGSYGKLEKCIRSLFVGKLYLWPRSHAIVCDSYANRKQPNIMEIRIEMPPIMKEMQFALINLKSRCINELNSMGTFDKSDDVSFDTFSVISSNFHLIKKKLDPVWYQLSNKTRRYISDIQVFERLLFKLTEIDAIEYYQELNTIREKVNPYNNPSDWLFWPYAESLFTLAEKLVSNTLEINPKLKALGELLKDIKSKIENEPQNSSQSEEKLNIIIVVKSNYTTKQIEYFLNKGEHWFLDELENKRKAMIGVKKNLDTNESNQESNQLLNLNFDPEKDERLENELFDQAIFTRKLHYYEWFNNDSCSLADLLFSQKPKIIILYQPEISCIRQIELYQALTAAEETPPLDVYFFIVQGSIEEQSYLENLRFEMSSFHKLIDEKLRLANVKENEGIFGEHPDLVCVKPDKINSLNTRIGGSEKKSISPNKVLVDFREFRSSLVGNLDKFGIEVEPVMLQIGDYIIAPEICIERKTINDLINSLNNGRLYSQTQLLTRYYKKPILLIEFPEDEKSFNFKSRHWGITLNSSSNFFSFQANPLEQLSRLKIAFPLLSIIWSPSAHFTADIIKKLKEGKPNPNKDTDVINVNLDPQLPNEYLTDRYDIEVKEFLLRLNGINSLNVYTIMNTMPIRHLRDKSLKELEKLLKNSHDARLLYNQLHSPYQSSNLDTDKQSVPIKNQRFNYVRNKPKK